jgi:hypothetical protein
VNLQPVNTKSLPNTAVSPSGLGEDSVFTHSHMAHGPFEGLRSVSTEGPSWKIAQGEPDLPFTLNDDRVRHAPETITIPGPNDTKSAAELGHELARLMGQPSDKPKDQFNVMPGTLDQGCCQLMQSLVESHPDAAAQAMLDGIQQAQAAVDLQTETTGHPHHFVNTVAMSVAEAFGNDPRFWTVFKAYLAAKDQG